MPTDVLTRNHVRVSGRGTQPMLFAHGFGCDQNMWRFVAPAFEDDYRVVRFDYVGSGRATFPPTIPGATARWTATPRTCWTLSTRSSCATSSSSGTR